MPNYRLNIIVNLPDRGTASHIEQQDAQNALALAVHTLENDPRFGDVYRAWADRLPAYGPSPDVANSTAKLHIEGPGIDPEIEARHS